MMRPGGGSLRARLIALLLATLIPLVGLGIYWIVMEVRQEQARTERDTQKTAALVSVEAGRLVSATQGMLAVLARLPAVQKPDPGEAARLFREILANSTHLENIALVGADGVVLASAVPVPSIGPIHLEDRDWFQRTVQSGQPAVGGYQVGRVAGKPIAVLSHPVLDNTGRVTAVVAAALRLAAVSQEVAPARIKAPIVWAVVDERGVVLLHSEPWGAIGRPLGPLTGMSRAEAVTPGTLWRAVVGAPEATVATGLRQVLPVVGLPALLILLAAGGVALWLARDIWRPLQALTASVRRIGAGERGVVLAIEGVGELGMVATALQDALGAVAAREADLIRRHKELAALVDATRAIASSLNLEEILQAIVHQAATISGTPIVRLFLLDEDAQVLRYRVGLGLPLEAEQGLAIPVGESFSGQVAATGRPVAVADCREDPRQRYPEHALK
ncbi:MAG: cache domain-containing protein, partial [Candidatus Methylomirabilales bacterium]